MNNIFFTSDTHFGHNKILEFCPNRPGETVEELGEIIIDRWNKVVGHADTIFHLGDFSFMGTTSTRSIVERLNGKIILIRGNHDSFKTVKNCNFNLIVESMVFRIGKQKIGMAHQPERVPQNCNFGLCGHLHNFWKFAPAGVLEWEDRATRPPTTRTQHMDRPLINVGVDQWDCAPVSFETLLVLVQKNGEE